MTQPQLKSAWGSGRELKIMRIGPRGADGTTGAAGSTGATGATGTAGAAGTAGTAGTVIQRTRVQTNTAGLAAWTFPSAYGAGVVPVIEVVAEGPSDNSSEVVAQLEGVPTNTGASVRATRSIPTDITVGIVTYRLPVLTTAGATYVHIIASAP